MGREQPGTDPDLEAAKGLQPAQCRRIGPIDERGVGSRVDGAHRGGESDAALSKLRLETGDETGEHIIFRGRKDEGDEL